MYHLELLFFSYVKPHVLQTDFLVDVVLESVLVLELFLAVLTGVDGRLGMLDDHVPTQTEGMSRTCTTKFTSIELGVVIRLDTHFQELHQAEA